MRGTARGQGWTEEAVADVALAARNRPESFTRPCGTFEGAPLSHAKDVQKRRQWRGEQMALLQAKAREIARDKGIQPEDFKASKHWVSRFMRRAGFSLRRRTSISQKLPESYEEHLVAFQRDSRCFSRSASSY
ncbi:hypothetical protein HPB52_013064 [Rhipicephalus sanguineus]|uniref:HTH CENPB-type domain-containing protein n=1 Tax=Rhipicephalus sanguineus TaxID=34632 RepID=A0A9D4YPW8_RHISA|nr:hypothetical protein HPB52_013064 [Rhipicephalus sanguineus]